MSSVALRKACGALAGMFAVSPMRTIDASPRTVTSISPSRTWNVSSKSWRYMSQTLAAVLVFIAARLLLEEVVHVPPIVSLAGVLLILGVGVALSLAVDRKRPPDPPSGRAADHLAARRRQRNRRRRSPERQRGVGPGVMGAPDSALGHPNGPTPGRHPPRRRKRERASRASRLRLRRTRRAARRR